jgi:hypothetical protein
MGSSARNEGGEMKPRIRKVHGMWHCGLIGIRNRHVGLGYTPMDAYRDWCAAGKGVK